MTKDAQRIALLKLDGWRRCDCREQPCDYWIHETSDTVGSPHYCDATHYHALPKHLEFYDAIIPLIQKQGDLVIRKVVQRLECKFFDELTWTNVVEMFKATPAQLCEALLRATDKWREE